MLRVAAILAIAAFIAPVIATALTEDPDPIGVDVSSAVVRGKSVIVPVTNASYEPVTVLVTGFYDDLTEIHEAQVMVPLAPKQTAAVTVTYTITDDINPQVQIIETPDPIAGAMALGAVLWSD